MKKLNTTKDFDTKETIAARVPINEMVIDKQYQGHVTQPLVEKIAANWNEESAGAVILNLREDNSFAVLDGQHRVAAAKKAGVKELNALVYVGKSKEEEARLFIELNTKHTVRPYDKFRAALSAGDKRAIEITSVLHELGLHITSRPTSPTSVSAIVPLMRIYDGFGIAHLKTVMGTLQSAFREYRDPNAYGADAIVGMSQFIFRYPEASLPKLIDKVSKYSPTTVRGMAVQRAIEGRRDSAWGRTITNIYNASVRMNAKNFLPPDRWDKTKYSPAMRAKVAARGEKTLRTLPKELREKYQFKKGVPLHQQTSMKAAAKKAKV